MQILGLAHGIVCRYSFLTVNPQPESDMVMSEELKDCPFCGYEAGIRAHEPYHYKVFCRSDECGVFMDYFTTTHGAAHQWNTRTHPKGE